MNDRETTDYLMGLVNSEDADGCLLLQGVVVRESKADCLKRINKLDWSNTDTMIERFGDAGVWIDRCAEEDWNEVKLMKERLKEAVQVVYDCRNHGSRNVDFINVDGVGKILITGGPLLEGNPTDELDDFNLFNEFLGYPYWAKKNSKELKNWHKMGRKK